MSIVEILLSVLFPLLIGVGMALAMGGASQAEFWIAKGVFVAAGIDTLASASLGSIHHALRV